MKELKVQSLLRKGKTLEQLESKYGIKSNISECGNLVNLKYSQIDSPKTSPIVRECRGIVLQMNSWDLISQAFYRFFNFGEDTKIEAGHIIDMAIMEKVDGSLITFFFDPTSSKWRMSTSGTIDGASNVGDYPITFNQLFFDTLNQLNPKWQSLVDQDIVYTFELTSPENRVVTHYPERGLTLLAARRRSNAYWELTYEELQDISITLGIRLANRYELHTLEDIITSFKELPPLDEGYVAVNYNKRDEFGNFERVKIKNPTYVAKHHLKDSACNSRRALFGVILTGEVDEVLNTFPEFTDTIRDLETKWASWRQRHEDWIKQCIDEDWSPQRIGRETPNDIHTGLVFEIIRGKCKDIDAFVLKTIEKRTFKGACKKLMEFIE